MGPISSAVLTFIGYKQTDRQTDKPNLHIDYYYYYLKIFEYVVSNPLQCRDGFQFKRGCEIPI